MSDKIDVQKARDAAAVISALQSTRDRLMPVLAEQYGDAFDGDLDVMLEAINYLKRHRYGLAQIQPFSELIGAAMALIDSERNSEHALEVSGDALNRLEAATERAKNSHLMASTPNAQLSFESALAGLIDLVCPGLDSGDVLRDATKAARKLSISANALASLVDAAGLALAEIDTCGHNFDRAYRTFLHDAWTNGKAALGEATEGMEVEPLVRQAIARLRATANGEWDGKTFDPELTDITQKILVAKRQKLPWEEPEKCSVSPDAKHGMDKVASQASGQYVCICEGHAANIGSPALLPIWELAKGWQKRSREMALTSYTGATLDTCAGQLMNLLRQHNLEKSS